MHTTTYKLAALYYTISVHKVCKYIFFFSCGGVPPIPLRFLLNYPAGPKNGVQVILF